MLVRDVFTRPGVLHINKSEEEQTAFRGIVSSGLEFLQLVL